MLTTVLSEETGAVELVDGRVVDDVAWVETVVKGDVEVVIGTVVVVVRESDGRTVKVVCVVVITDPDAEDESVEVGAPLGRDPERVPENVPVDVPGVPDVVCSESHISPRTLLDLAWSSGWQVLEAHESALEMKPEA